MGRWRLCWRGWRYRTGSDSQRTARRCELHYVRFAKAQLIDRLCSYVTDTLLSTIFSFSYDLPTGTIDLSSRKIFVNTKAEANGGLPDGLAVDAADHVWCAKFRGSRVTRYRPDGSIDLEILFDKAQNITCIEFGGRGKDFLTTLFVTTSSLAESGQGGKQALLDKVRSILGMCKS